MAETRQTIQPPRFLLFLIAVLQFIHTSWATHFVLRLFFSPNAFPYPQRERELLETWPQTQFEVDGKSVCAYHLEGEREKILLVHGWSGRATQLGILAEQLNHRGFDVWILDGPGHGMSEKGRTSLFDFIASILKLHELHGPFSCGVGHSLGGLALLGAASRGLPWKKIGLIGTPNKVSDVLHRFCDTLGVNASVERGMIAFLENKYKDHVDTWSAQNLVSHLDVPGFILHDESDLDVPLSNAEQIKASWGRCELFKTKDLGHRRILRDPNALQHMVKFIESPLN